MPPLSNVLRRQFEKAVIAARDTAEAGARIVVKILPDRLEVSNPGWLYVVTFCKGEKPRLRIIQDPMANLSAELLYRQVQYVVQESDWSTHGEEVVRDEATA